MSGGGSSSNYSNLAEEENEALGSCIKVRSGRARMWTSLGAPNYYTLLTSKVKKKSGIWTLTLTLSHTN